MQWLIQKNAELFPATSSCVLWISNDLRRVAALGNYMLSHASLFTPCNKLDATWTQKQNSDSVWVSLAALGSCQRTLTMSTCLSRIQPLLQQTTNNWKIPMQTDVTCSGVLLQLCSWPSILLISSTIWCRFLLISAPLLSESKRRKNRRENCSTAASQSGCVHLGSIERARYATKHLRDTDSDYVMKKPSQCWLGAVPRYWKVVASCFEIVSFAENTSTPLAPRALLNLSTKRCLRFFYSVSKFSGVQKKTEFA